MPRSLSKRLAAASLAVSLAISAALAAIGFFRARDGIRDMYVKIGAEYCDAIGSMANSELFLLWLKSAPPLHNDLERLRVVAVLDGGLDTLFDTDGRYDNAAPSWGGASITAEAEARLKEGVDGVFSYYEGAPFPRYITVIKAAGIQEGARVYAIARLNTEDMADKEAAALTAICAAAALLTIGAVIAYYVFTRVFVINPIKRIARGAEAFASAELGAEPPAKAGAGDELARLGESMRFLQRAVRDYSVRLTAASKKAATDVLTGLYNRESLLDCANEFLAGARGRHHACSLIVADLDHFKNVNDTFGHAIGDETLFHAANALRGMFRAESAGDIVSRYGGDEFAVFCKGLGDIATLRHKLTALSSELSRVILPDGGHITMSVGVAVAVGNIEGVTYKRLFEVADSALYNVKHNGRDGYEIRRVNSETGEAETIE